MYIKYGIQTVGIPRRHGTEPAHSEDSQQFLKNELIPAVTEEFQLTVRVRSTSEPIRLTRRGVHGGVVYIGKRPMCLSGCATETSCVHVLVPSAHLGADDGCSRRTAPGRG
ncbi:hypothetical protein LSAT2_022073 [Lamellibrachia satsuma]|nr:hypothetical protein LSAT2_022073 [Lamellibrachia satsuma]